jgi:hypothetical protein
VRRNIVLDLSQVLAILRFCFGKIPSARKKTETGPENFWYNYVALQRRQPTSGATRFRAARSPPQILPELYKISWENQPKAANNLNLPQTLRSFLL